MRSSKKISKIVFLLSLVTAISLLTVVSINGLNFQTEHNEIDYDSSSSITLREGGGSGGEPSFIIYLREGGGSGGEPSSIIQI